MITFLFFDLLSIAFPAYARHRDNCCSVGFAVARQLKERQRKKEVF